MYVFRGNKGTVGSEATPACCDQSHPVTRPLSQRVRGEMDGFIYGDGGDASRLAAILFGSLLTKVEERKGILKPCGD